MWKYFRDEAPAFTCALKVIVYQIVAYILATELSLAILIGSACAATLSLDGVFAYRGAEFPMSKPEQR
jgi:hypothetical protein